MRCKEIKRCNNLDSTHILIPAKLIVESKEKLIIYFFFMDCYVIETKIEKTLICIIHNGISLSHILNKFTL